MKQKNVFITGISKGLGQALVKQYLRHNWSVIGVSRNISDTISDNFISIQGDITKVETFTKIKNTLNDQKIDTIDLLINNAGQGSHWRHLSEIDLTEIQNQIKLHCIAAIQTTQLLIEYLKKSDHPMIVNVTSRLGSVHQHLRGDFKNKPFSYAYRIAKAAQNMFTLCLREDSELENIIVVSLNPGLLKTDSGSFDASHSAEEGAERIYNMLTRQEVSGIVHAFGEETWY